MARGRKNGIFTDWSNCETSVHKFKNAVSKGFPTLEQAIHFMMATREYSKCENIPVHDLGMVITVSDIGHKCTTGCTSLITSHSDSEEEDSEVQLNLPQKMGQDGTILIQGDVHEDKNCS